MDKDNIQDILVHATPNESNVRTAMRFCGRHIFIQKRVLQQVRTHKHRQTRTNINTVCGTSFTPEPANEVTTDTRTYDFDGTCPLRLYWEVKMTDRR